MDIALDIASVRTVRGSPSRVHVFAPRRRRAGHQGCRREHLADVDPSAPLSSRERRPSTFDALQRKLGRVPDIDRDYSNLLMAQTYGQASIAEWYPGDAYVDWVGADGYNSFGCYGGPGAWQDFSTIFSAFNAFAVAHDKRAVVAKWGSVEDPATPGRKAQWITDAAQTIESWPRIKAASYFDGFGRSGTCKRGLGTSASALTAFKNMSALPYFNPRPTAAITADPVKGPAPLTVTFDASGSTGELNPISSWQLDFGDGSTPASGTGPPASITHTYATGTYTATLEVADATGQYQVQTTGRIAADPPPTVHTGLSSDRTTSGVTLSGAVNPNGLHTSCHFE